MFKAKQLHLDPSQKTDPAFQSLRHLSDIHMTKSENVRRIRCFCGQELRRSILPHMRQEHASIWEDWKAVFVILRNRKWSYRKIMEAFRANGELLFSWAVIERELRKAEEAGQIQLEIWKKDEVRHWEPKDFELERTTIWNFPVRGTWAVHQGDYRGNWPPQLARNLILKYTKRGGKVVDLFVGGGTTVIECWLLGRESVGIDISPFAVKMARGRLDEMNEKAEGLIDFDFNPNLRPLILQGDTREFDQYLREVGWQPGTVDLICAHPPYLNALKYTEAVNGDLSHLRNPDEFYEVIHQVVLKARDWLNREGIVAVLIGDIRKDGELIPLGFGVFQTILDAGYRIREIIVKAQNRDHSTHIYRHHPGLDYLIGHEYLFIFSPLSGS